MTALASPPPWPILRDLVAAQGMAALVTVARTLGSAPREVGAWMAVRPDGAFHGTIGGGRLEWEALQIAREALSSGRQTLSRIDRALGPDLGQCCGGRVVLDIRVFRPDDLPDLIACIRVPGEDSRQPVLLFGAGHVGRAVALAAAPLPFRLRWIDTRPDAFPPHIPANALPVPTTLPETEIAAAPPGSFVAVMTHDHALDLVIVAAALRRPDLPYIGLIGSATKRARFEKRLAELGHDEATRARLVCPIGLPGIAGKEPAVIAAAIVAQWLEARVAAPACLPSPEAVEASR